MAGLSPIEIVALAKCVKDSEITEARAAIPDGSAHSVDFSVRISGAVTRAGGTRAGVGVIAESKRPLDMTGFQSVCALLRELKVGAKRLEGALRAITDEPATDAEFAAVFDRVSLDRSKTIPEIKIAMPAKSGNITVKAAAARVT